MLDSRPLLGSAGHEGSVPRVPRPEVSANAATALRSLPRRSRASENLVSIFMTQIHVVNVNYYNKIETS